MKVSSRVPFRNPKLYIQRQSVWVASPSDTMEPPSGSETGVFGNTHIMMQDDNSGDIAETIADWLEVNVS